MANTRTFSKIINLISELYQLMHLPKPDHPLISVIKLEDTAVSGFISSTSLIFNFYSISMKRNVKIKFKYGQNYYDFDEGILALMSPGQIISTDVIFVVSLYASGAMTFFCLAPTRSTLLPRLSNFLIRESFC